MITDVQTDLVTHFDGLRAALPAEATEVAPITCEPYAGQLLHPDALALAVPALYVDVEASEFEEDDESGELLIRTPTAELILGTLNQASEAARYADGLALASWTLRALFDRPLQIGGKGYRPHGPVRFRRIASDARLWAGRITVSLTLPT